MLFKLNNTYTKKYIDVILIFFLMVIIFTLILKFSRLDLHAHIAQAQKMNSDQASYPSNFLYYLLLNFFSFFNTNFYTRIGVAILLLSLATTAKYVISKTIIFEYLSINKISYPINKIALFSLGLLLMFSIPDFYSLFTLDYWYLSRFPPTVWHNSTTIFVFPFAILLFWKQFLFMHSYSKTNFKTIIVLIGLVILNIIIKPSFLFVFIPVTGIYILITQWKKGLRKMFIFALPSIVGILLLLFSYLLIYQLQTGSFQKESSSISLSPLFYLYQKWMPLWYIPISLLISLLFPIILFFIFLKNKININLSTYTFSMTFLAILISAFVIETGPRETHGNFIWQNIIAVYILQLVSTILYIQYRINPQKSMIKKNILLFIFSLHIISGVLYISRIILFNDVF